MQQHDTFPFYSAGDIVNLKILSYSDGSTCTKETQQQKNESKKSLQQQQVDHSSFQQQQQLQVHQQYSDQHHQPQQQQKQQQQSDQSKGFRQAQQLTSTGAGGEVVQATASNSDMQQTRRKPRTSVGETLAHGSHQPLGYRYSHLQICNMHYPAIKVKLSCNNLNLSDSINMVLQPPKTIQFG